ncbi:hypothetical protein GXW76_24100 [Roseomonas soli]|uniref:Uncharacterized protein n=1 Tax=Neoroseomonas soli TaxID=1081025 RepID=A0A9X9X4E8_9PROT|nr:hypothetical protein [Neoroseomonas soli]
MAEPAPAVAQPEAAPAEPARVEPVVGAPVLPKVLDAEAETTGPKRRGWWRR